MQSAHRNHWIKSQSQQISNQLNSSSRGQNLIETTELSPYSDFLAGNKWHPLNQVSTVQRFFRSTVITGTRAAPVCEKQEVRYLPMRRYLRAAVSSTAFPSPPQNKGCFSEALNKPPSGTRSPHSSTAQGRSQAAPGPQRQNKGWWLRTTNNNKSTIANSLICYNCTTQ